MPRYKSIDPVVTVPRSDAPIADHASEHARQRALSLKRSLSDLAYGSRFSENFLFAVTALTVFAAGALLLAGLLFEPRMSATADASSCCSRASSIRRKPSWRADFAVAYHRQGIHV